MIRVKTVSMETTSRNYLGSTLECCTHMSQSVLREKKIYETLNRSKVGCRIKTSRNKTEDSIAVYFFNWN